MCHSWLVFAHYCCVKEEFQKSNSLNDECVNFFLSVHDSKMRICKYCIKTVVFIRGENHVSDVIQKIHFRSTVPLQSVSPDTETLERKYEINMN